ncbi:MAG TPA: hypothetical protein VLJ68_01215 [Chitinophagaceae bacterium]|nr:hypothetical protein [Chitinophagaceae bacterium]
MYIHVSLMLTIQKPTDQKDFGKPNPPDKQAWIEKLLNNRITIADLDALKGKINAEDLSNIIQRIYDLNEKYILKLSTIEGAIRKFDDIKNAKRNKHFTGKIMSGFRDASKKERKIILAEGDSWFNYPVILTDIIDWVSMEKNFAVYSLASGGDWLLNMLTARHYVEELSLLHPDVFLISGGGNDLVGSSRLAAIVEPGGKSNEYDFSPWAKKLIDRANTDFVEQDKDKLMSGLSFLSRDFFALLMFFRLQYYYLINGILNAGESKKFEGIKIITQGYDYPIPSYKKNFGLKPWRWYVPFVRMFLGHGRWLKTPLQMRGIRHPGIQENILYAMIYLFNEMMVETGEQFNAQEKKSVFHIDCRGTVGKKGWTDELHALPVHFKKIADVFNGCIREDLSPTYDHVFVVTPRKK